MIRLKYHTPGTPPATLLPVGAGGCAPVIRLIQYDKAGYAEHRPGSVEELDALLDPKKINWIHVCGLGDVSLLRALSARFHVHPLALEDVLNTTQRPKVEHFDNHLFIVSEWIHPDGEGHLAIEQISLFLGDHYLLSFQEESHAGLYDPIRQRLKSGQGYARGMKTDYLAYALLDAMVDQFFPILEDVGGAIEEIEDELVDRPSRATLRKLYDSRRVLLQLRRAAWPQREVFNTLIRDETQLVSPEVKIFLSDGYDHCIQIIDILENCRDLTAGLMDVYLSSLGFRTNEIMRVLTVASVFFLPLSFLAAVYGMNFDQSSHWNMPEARWPFGYAFFWLLCLLIVLGMLVFFKRKKWL